MSRFFSEKFAFLTPYTPGEQPKERQFVKLNTNESPFPPAPGVAAAVAGQAGMLQLYSDPEVSTLRNKLAETYGVSAGQVICANGSDEVLNFAFMAFADEARPLAFPDLTYGFYPVFAQLNRIPYQEIPLKEDFSIDVNDYIGINKTIVIANPNAPTGLSLPVWQIEEILKTNPDSVVVVDEAYVDFGGESCYPLIDRYDNLLVVRTFSKSRCLAGGRLGYAIGPKELIADLEKLKFSTNPYNVNRLTMRLGEVTVDAESYYQEKCGEIIRVREWTAKKLEEMGFEVLPSKTNFLFARSEKIDGERLYLMLKKRGVLVRHFSNPRIREFNRITIGTASQMQRFIEVVQEILEGGAL